MVVSGYNNKHFEPFSFLESYEAEGGWNVGSLSVRCVQGFHTTARKFIPVVCFLRKIPPPKDFWLKVSSARWLFRKLVLENCDTNNIRGWKKNKDCQWTLITTRAEKYGLPRSELWTMNCGTLGEVPENAALLMDT